MSEETDEKMTCRKTIICFLRKLQGADFKRLENSYFHFNLVQKFFSSILCLNILMVVTYFKMYLI